MTLYNGIYVFYPVNASSHGDHNQTGLNWLRFDGKQVVDSGSADISGVGDGVSAFYYNGYIYIYSSIVYNGLPDVISQHRFDGSSFIFDGYIRVNGSFIATMFRTGAYLLDNTTYVYYADQQRNFQGAKIVMGETVWTPASTPSAKLDGGPALFANLGHLNCVSATPTNLRLSWRYGPDDWHSLDHQAFIQANPTAALYDTTIYTFYHAAGGLLYATLDSNRQWHVDQIVPGVGAYGSPGVCVYGNRLYCFYQGGSNTLWFSQYVASQWTPGTFQLQGEGTNNVWWGPWAVAIEGLSTNVSPTG